MSKLADAVRALIGSSLNQLMFPTRGTVESFDSTTKRAVVRIPQPHSSKMTTVELPWLRDPQGAYFPDPDPGTLIVVVFLDGDARTPYIIQLYDELYAIDTRESLKRDTSTYVTRTDKIIATKTG